MLSIGHENFVSKKMVSGIYNIKSSPIKSLVSAARAKDLLIDATKGKARKSVIVLSDGHVILSSISPKTLAVERFPS